MPKKKKPRAPRNPRTQSWQQFFAPSLLEEFLKPRLEVLLRLGVTSKADLRKRFHEAYGYLFTNETLNAILRDTGLMPLFEAPSTIRLEGSLPTPVRSIGNELSSRPLNSKPVDVLVEDALEAVRRNPSLAKPGTRIYEVLVAEGVILPNAFPAALSEQDEDGEGALPQGIRPLEGPSHRTGSLSPPAPPGGGDNGVPVTAIPQY